MIEGIKFSRRQIFHSSLDLDDLVLILHQCTSTDKNVMLEDRCPDEVESVDDQNLCT